MTDDDLKAIKARAEAATPGPWDTNGHYIDREEAPRGEFERLLYNGGRDDVYCNLTEADLEFIAHARTDVPALVEELRRAVGVIRAIIDASDQCQGHRSCAHSMLPWGKARELLYEFDNNPGGLEYIRDLMASHERYRE